MKLLVLLSSALGKACRFTQSSDDPSIASIPLNWFSVRFTVFQREGVKAGVTVIAHIRVPCPEEPKKCWDRVLTIHCYCFVS